MANRMLTALALLLLLCCFSAAEQVNPDSHDFLRFDSVDTDPGLQADANISFYTKSIIPVWLENIYE
jgi:hypothetical protein